MPGLNTVAVEVHQSTNTSSDIGFDFELTAITDTTPPSVTLTNPPTSGTFTAGDNMPLGASAADDSGVAQVEFYANGSFVGTDTTAPYAATLGNARFGSYILTAVAQDTAGLRATSGPVVIEVQFATNAVTLIANRTCWRYWDRGLDPGPDWSSHRIASSRASPLALGDGRSRTAFSQSARVRTTSLPSCSQVRALVSWKTLASLSASPSYRPSK